MSATCWSKVGSNGGIPLNLADLAKDGKPYHRAMPNRAAPSLAGRARNGAKRERKGPTRNA